MRNVVITVVAAVLIMVSFLAGARMSYSKPETSNVPGTTSVPSVPVETGTPVYITKCTKVVAYKYCSEYTTYKVREH